jgi:hypothetical protein
VKLIAPVLAAVAVLALIAGCGGGSSSSSTSTPIAVDPLAKEADAICQATDEATETLQAEFEKASDPGAADYDAKLGELLVRIVVIGRTETEELMALKPSADQAAAYERWLAVGKEGLADFEGAALALKKEGQSPNFTRFYEQGQVRLTQANKIAANQGFKVCGGQRI